MTFDGLEVLAIARSLVARCWHRDGAHAHVKVDTMLDECAAADLWPRTLFEQDPAKQDRLMLAITRSTRDTDAGRS